MAFFDHSVHDVRKIATRISQYEMAFKMQTSVPGLMDISSEPQSVLDMYGTKGADGSFCGELPTRPACWSRLNGVRFIQLLSSSDGTITARTRWASPPRRDWWTALPPHCSRI